MKKIQIICIFIFIICAGNEVLYAQKTVYENSIRELFLTITKLELEINSKIKNGENIKNDHLLNIETKSDKKKRVQFSLLEHDYNNLKKLADITDTSIHYYIIRLILKDLYGENRLLGNQIEELRKSNYELHKIGVNINQIARALNSGESDNIKIDLKQLNDFLKTHVDYVMGILSENIKSY